MYKEELLQPDLYQMLRLYNSLVKKSLFDNLLHALFINFLGDLQYADPLAISILHVSMECEEGTSYQ